MDISGNWGLLGHEWAVELLKGHLVNQNTRQAYLITGSQGVGRRTLAIRFAQAANCTKSKESALPCGECRSCDLIWKMQHPDLAIIKSEEPSGTLKVNQIRELQHSLSLTAYENIYKFGLILDFEQANQNAANALLKTLEEPPGHVILALTANDPEALLPTIISRCELIRLRPININRVSNWLQMQWKIAESDADLLAHISGGRPGYALHLSQNPDIVQNRRNYLNELINLLSSTRVQRFLYAEEIYQNKTTLLLILQIWLTFWRDLMLRSIDSSSSVTNCDFEDEIQKLTESVDVLTAQAAVNKIEKCIDQLDKNINLRLMTEVLMLDIPYI
jgi:DNA polymerase-3 subunit delta'